jgi:YfiH family protein
VTAASSERSADRGRGADARPAEGGLPRLPEPFRWSARQIAIALPGGHGVFSTRAGGDLASSSGPSQELRDAVGLPPQDWAQDVQVHGARVRVLEFDAEIVPLADESDGIATERHDAACVVRTADCVPIALIAPQAVAMLHGGWRGLAAGVVERGVAALRSLGADPVRAAIGPHARVCCYEAGTEVHEAFAALGLDVRRGENADLEAVTRALLSRAGVGEIHATGLCTICSAPELLWSHRRDGERAGRQGGIAWRS